MRQKWNDTKCSTKSEKAEKSEEKSEQMYQTLG